MRPYKTHPNARRVCRVFWHILAVAYSQRYDQSQKSSSLWRPLLSLCHFVSHEYMGSSCRPWMFELLFFSKCFNLLRVLRVPYENEGMSKNPNSLLLKRRSMDWYAVYYWFSVGITIVRQFCDDRGDLLAYKPCMNFEGLHDRSHRQDNAADTSTEVTWLLNLCTSKTCGII